MRGEIAFLGGVVAAGAGGSITSVLNRKNSFAVGKICAKVAVSQSHEEQVL